MTAAGPPAGSGDQVRVRFAVAPGGDLHLAAVRTALCNWAFARHGGGRFIVRIEDIDRSRVKPERVATALETLRWLGLHWDEGPETGGPCGPYRQRERLAVYAGWAARFLDAGHAYHCYCSRAELARRRGVPGGAGGWYDGHCRGLSRRQAASYRAQGRRPVVRFRMPAGPVTVTDLVRGEVSFTPGTDFVLVCADGTPRHILAAAVDDVLMGITHVIRGEDLLSSTPAQVAIGRAMGVAEADLPAFGHLPHLLGRDGRPLSGRGGAVGWYRRQGFLPGAIRGYLALLGGLVAGGREPVTLADLAARFRPAEVSGLPSRFSVRRLEAVNRAAIRRLPPSGFAGRVAEFLIGAGLVAGPPSVPDAALIAAAAPLVQQRASTLLEAAAMLAFLFGDEAEFRVDAPEATATLGAGAVPALAAAEAALSGLGPSWDAAGIAAALRAALIDGLGLKPRVAYAGAVRVAITGRRTGPPLFAAIALLGRDRTLGRLARARASAMHELEYL